MIIEYFGGPRDGERAIVSPGCDSVAVPPPPEALFVIDVYFPWPRDGFGEYRRTERVSDDGAVEFTWAGRS
jgi:hypothetical protein